MPDNTDSLDLRRYDRQMKYGPIGVEGQKRLLRSRVLVCGAGALGSVSAEMLVRAGVGHLRIVDRDFLELNNLQGNRSMTSRMLPRDYPKQKRP